MKELITGSIRTFELVQWLTGPLEGDKFDDYPAIIQDKVLAALEKKSDEVGLPLAILGVRCEMDYEANRWYLMIVASEVVVADSRTIDHRRLH